ERLRRAFSSAALLPSELTESPEVTFEAKEKLRLIYQVLDRMPERLRFAWILSEIDEVSGAEIAEILGISPTAALSRSCRAREAFDALFVRFYPPSDGKRRPLHG